MPEGIGYSPLNKLSAAQRRRRVGLRLDDLDLESMIAEPDATMVPSDMRTEGAKQHDAQLAQIESEVRRAQFPTAQSMIPGKQMFGQTSKESGDIARSMLPYFGGAEDAQAIAQSETPTELAINTGLGALGQLGPLGKGISTAAPMLGMALGPVATNIWKQGERVFGGAGASSLFGNTPRSPTVRADEMSAAMEALGRSGVDDKNARSLVLGLGPENATNLATRIGERIRRKQAQGSLYRGQSEFGEEIYTAPMEGDLLNLPHGTVEDAYELAILNARADGRKWPTNEEIAGFIDIVTRQGRGRDESGLSAQTRRLLIKGTEVPISQQPVLRSGQSDLYNEQGFANFGPGPRARTKSGVPKGTTAQGGDRLSIEDTADFLEDTIRNASAEDLQWYRFFSQDVGDIIGRQHTPEFGAVFAILSPQSPVETNLRDAVETMIWVREYVDKVGAQNVTRAGFIRDYRRAFREEGEEGFKGMMGAPLADRAKANPIDAPRPEKGRLAGRKIGTAFESADGERLQKAKSPDEAIGKLADFYLEGVMKGDLKTRTFALSVHEKERLGSIAGTVNDVMIAQFFDIGDVFGSESVSKATGFVLPQSAQAYRAAQAHLALAAQEVSDRLGTKVTPDEIQAIAWAVIKRGESPQTGRAGQQIFQPRDPAILGSGFRELNPGVTPGTLESAKMFSRNAIDRYRALGIQDHQTLIPTDDAGRMVTETPPGGFPATAETFEQYATDQTFGANPIRKLAGKGKAAQGAATHPAISEAVEQWGATSKAPPRSYLLPDGRYLHLGGGGHEDVFTLPSMSGRHPDSTADFIQSTGSIRATIEDDFAHFEIPPRAMLTPKQMQQIVRQARGKDVHFNVDRKPGGEVGEMADFDEFATASDIMNFLKGKR